ncbi:MAG: DUF2325 domain-containing protein [Thermodesulfovibrio sp.]|nr:DUF2325 domain-containing protein [Thermodesulfovibrio sp.]MDW7997895.1 DUF2325 domain-containing protein [Thermodesulfovibrio sp.]
MSILLVGGMDRLERHYLNEAISRGVNLKVFTKPTKDIGRKIGKIDAIVIFTDKVSHSVKNEIINLAKAKKIPFFMYHSCGICTFRKCLDCLQKLKKEGGLA